MDETRVRDPWRSSGLGALMTISRDEKRLDDNQDATRRDPTDLLHALQILRTPTSARQHCQTRGNAIVRSNEQLVALA